MPDRAPDRQPEPPGAAKRKLVGNERVKLGATVLNTLAAAAVVTGAMAPAAAALYGVSLPKSPYWLWFGLGWIGLAGCLHAVARRILGDMEP